MCRSDTSETKTQQKRAFPCAAIGTYSPLRFLLCTPFPYPLTPTKPAFTVVFYPFYLSPILSIVSYLSPPPRSFAIFSLHIEYLLFVLLSSAALWIYNLSADGLIISVVSNRISQVNVVYHCGNSDQMALPSVDFLNPLS